jgi:dTDP-4-amino-4,6-dideoxygalactose transaminase
MRRAAPTGQTIPLLRPNPPKLSLLQPELLALEESGFFTNNGPNVRRFEEEAALALFGGVGACVSVSNATIGLVLALKQAAMAHGRPGGLALMPSFTFAATAHAALWAGLTPVLCDIDPQSWTASAASEDALLAQYGDRIAAIVPYASFGSGLDLDRYQSLADHHHAAVVVDAASSLGSVDADGRNFGTGSRLVFVYSMHATKTFAVGEGGLIYSADQDAIRIFRDMANFGFASGRSATMPGLNAKMSEVTALLARAKLRDITAIIAHRHTLTAAYRAALPGFGFQKTLMRQQAWQFMPVLLPPRLASSRPVIMARLARQGIGSGAYFSPHLAQQPYFKANCLAGDLRVTENIAGRILALPMSDLMTLEEVGIVCAALRQACGSTASSQTHATPRHRTRTAISQHAAIGAA